MNRTYIIQNQYNLYLSKQGEWSDGKDANLLYRTPHQDAAINTKVELSVRDPLLRLNVVSCTLNEKGRPEIDTETFPVSESIDRTATNSFDYVTTTSAVGAEESPISRED